MVKETESKLSSYRNAMLEEQAHEAKRQQLLERAAIVKKRMEAQGRAGEESVRKSRFDVMADRKYTKIVDLNFS